MASATDHLNEIIQRVEGAPPKLREQMQKDALAATAQMKWIPNVGPQTEAYDSIADELGYGGEPAGGKTDLLIGKALNKHTRSLILRRIEKEVPFLMQRLGEVLGYRREKLVWHLDTGQVIQFGGCQHAGDEMGYKGAPKDFIGFDEATEFLESQVEFIIQWLRTTKKGQRCQLVLATNPPMLAEGMWFVEWFAPWLDPTHPFYPTPYGHLLYCARDGKRWRWAGTPAPMHINGRTVIPKSRTFIRSALSDNPDLANTDYGDRLGNVSEGLRRVYKEGDFTAGMQDQERQLIPTSWIVAAQNRWHPDGWRGEAMSALALDPAGGGRDSAEIAVRYGCWFGPLVSKQDIETRDGEVTAACVMSVRRSQCPIIVDVGGGYAGAVLERFRDNKIEFTRFDGGGSSSKRSKKDKLRIANKRTEAWLELMEALDPEQEGGSPVALPPDAELRGDLAAPTFKIGARGIQLESKDTIRERLGRSPGKGDAVVMCYSEGNRALMRRHDRTGMSYPEQGIDRSNDGLRHSPKLIMGHTTQRRR